MKFEVVAFEVIWAMTINCKSTLPGLIKDLYIAIYRIYIHAVQKHIENV